MKDAPHTHTWLGDDAWTVLWVLSALENNENLYVLEKTQDKMKCRAIGLISVQVLYTRFTVFTAVV